MLSSASGEISCHTLISMSSLACHSHREPVDYLCSRDLIKKHKKEWISSFRHNSVREKKTKKKKTLWTGFKPARGDPNGFQVHRLNPLGHHSSYMHTATDILVHQPQKTYPNPETIPTSLHCPGLSPGHQCGPTENER